MKSGLAFLAGLIGGAALGVIFSTRSGKKTRNAIRRKAQDSVEQIAAATGEVTSQVKDAAAKGKEQVAEAVEAGKQAYRAQTARG
jgi:gas vesicle protein